jgi:hypothetical protein
MTSVTVGSIGVTTDAGAVASLETGAETGALLAEVAEAATTLSAVLVSLLPEE